MNGKSLLKHYCLKRKNFIVTKLWKMLQMQITCMQKKSVSVKSIMIFVLNLLHYFWLNVFENFRKMCLKIYHLDPAKFLSAPGLAWQAALKGLKYN